MRNYTLEFEVRVKNTLRDLRECLTEAIRDRDCCKEILDATLEDFDEMGNVDAWAFVQPLAMAMLLCARGPLEALLDFLWFDSRSLTQSFGCSLSLSMEEGLSTFGGMTGILAKF